MNFNKCPFRKNLNAIWRSIWAMAIWLYTEYGKWSFEQSGWFTFIILWFILCQSRCMTIQHFITQSHTICWSLERGMYQIYPNKVTGGKEYAYDCTQSIVNDLLSNQFDSYSSYSDLYSVSPENQSRCMTIQHFITRSHTVCWSLERGMYQIYPQ